MPEEVKYDRLRFQIDLEPTSKETKKEGKSSVDAHTKKKGRKPDIYC